MLPQNFRGRRRGGTPPIGQAEKLRSAAIAHALTGSLLALLLGNAEAQQCVTERVGQAELTEERGHYQVPVVIDQAAPLNFVVDTGAQKTVIDTEIAAGLGLPRRGDRRRRITGADGVAGRAYHDVTARQLDFAGLQHFDIGLATADDKEDGKRAVRPYDGLLGLDFLRSRKIWVSYATQQLFVHRGR